MNGVETDAIIVFDDHVKVKKLYEGNTHGMIYSDSKLIFSCQGKGIVVY